MPLPPTPLVGREEEIAAVIHTLTANTTRLLTITGPGGVGKTRLALQAGMEAGALFPEGVAFVSLADIADPSLAAPVLAKAVGAVERGENLEDLIVDRLGGRRMLVILDTFEHLLAAAPLVYSIMLRTPDARFLVTSRSALHVRGEQEYPIGPLAVPPEGAQTREQTVLSAPAIALFWDRALAVRPDLHLDASSAAEVVEICRRLDGLPLALELAAARVRHLPLAALREQLDQRLLVLAHGPLDLPVRQRTMSDTVAWSHDLLSPQQQAIFRALSSFSEGWTLPAAEFVCGQLEGAGDILAGVSTLVDHSLVFLSGGDVVPRYDMLDVVREYAAQRAAASGESDVLAQRHAAFHLALAEEAEPEMVKGEAEQWLAKLDAERGNLRKAMGWAIATRDADLALRFTVALWRYWRHRGEFAEGRRWSESSIALPRDVADSLRARALWATAALAFPQGDYARMSELATQSLEIARRGSDDVDLRNALSITGLAAMAEGRYADALEPFRRCVALLRSQPTSWHLGTSHLNLGMALLQAGEPSEAAHSFAEGHTVYAELGDGVFAARTRIWSAHAALAVGDVAQAESLAAQALSDFAGGTERLGVAEALETLAAVAAARNETLRAARLWGAGSAVRESIASRPPSFEQAITSRFLAAARDASGDESWDAAEAVGRTLDLDSAVAYGLEHEQPA